MEKREEHNSSRMLEKYFINVSKNKKIVTKEFLVHCKGHLLNNKTWQLYNCSKNLDFPIAELILLLWVSTICRKTVKIMFQIVFPVRSLGPLQTFKEP